MILSGLRNSLFFRGREACFEFYRSYGTRGEEEEKKAGLDSECCDVNGDVKSTDVVRFIEVLASIIVDDGYMLLWRLFSCVQLYWSYIINVTERYCGKCTHNFNTVCCVLRATTPHLYAHQLVFL